MRIGMRFGDIEETEGWALLFGLFLDPENPTVPHILVSSAIRVLPDKHFDLFVTMLRDSLDSLRKAPLDDIDGLI